MEPNSTSALDSIAFSLKRIADAVEAALVPQDGAATCELVQQVSEALTDALGSLPWGGAAVMRL
jgi:hypothetical protein